jgi:RNA 2',3'-cyclic 3'-phosphodiesterase
VNGTVRAFAALEIPVDMRERIAALVTSLKPGLPDVRWLAPDTYHLTLRFLGPSSPEALAALEAPLRAAAAAAAPMTVRVGGLGVFPAPRAARVLWLDLSLPPSLLDLQAACESGAVAAGYPPEARPFRAHLTLGRWREPRRFVPLPHEELGETRVDRLVLFRSDLKPAGAVHTPILAFPLG